MHEHARSAGPVTIIGTLTIPGMTIGTITRHAPVDFGPAFAIGAVLNLTFVAVEASYGVLANSLALLADAGHNLGDVLGLLLAWGATHLVKRAPTRERTYGYKRSSIAAALANAIILLITVGAITLEAIRRPRRARGLRQRYGDRGGGDRHPRQRPDRLAVHGGPRRRSQHPRHLPAHGGGCRDIGRRRRRRVDHAPDRLAVARPGGQPRHRRGDHLRHLGPAARFRQSGDGRGPRGDRSRRHRSLSRRPARRDRGCTICISGG